MSKPPFEALVRDHGAVVFRVCRAIVGPSDAEDAWSETFLAALRSYPRLAGDANHRAWLVRIAHNEAVDLVRAGERQRRISDRLAQAAPTAFVERSALDDRLAQALDALTTHQREAVAFHHLAGLPFSEVATILGCSPAAARRASADGIAALRTLLKENHA